MSPSRTSGIVFLWISLLLSAEAQDDLLITLTPGVSNRLTLQTDPASQDLYRIFESTPPFIGNQIDLRYSAAFNITNQSAPAGWQFQNVVLNDGSGNKVATYYFAGTASSTSNESVNLATPLHLDFNVEDLTGSNAKLNLRVEAHVNIHLNALGLSTNGIIFEDTIIPPPDSRLVAFRRANGLDLAGADDATDSSQNYAPNLFYYAFGLGTVDTVDIDRTRLPRTSEIPNSTQFTFLQHTEGITDDISYTVESSGDLITWTSLDELPVTERATSTIITPIDSDYERITLTFPRTSDQRFYRLKIAED